MRLLLDTQLLLWAARDTVRLSKRARDLIESEDNSVIFSVVSLWEVAIKHALRRPDFIADVAALRRNLLYNGYEELPLEAAHTIAFAEVPRKHKDPFDRMLLTQAICENLTLATTDDILRRYDGPVIRV